MEGETAVDVLLHEIVCFFEHDFERRRWYAQAGRERSERRKGRRACVSGHPGRIAILILTIERVGR